MKSVCWNSSVTKAWLKFALAFRAFLRQLSWLNMASEPVSIGRCSPKEEKEASLAAWMNAYRLENNQDAFQNVFEYYREKLWQKLHVSRFYGYDPEDLFQEVNRDIAAFLRKETPHNLMGLVYRIADRKVIDYLRSKAHNHDRLANISLEEERHLANPRIDQVKWSQTFDLQRFLFSNFISAKQREVLVLHFLLGHSVAEIHAQTGIPLNTVKSRIREGLRKLRLFASKRHRS